MERQREGVAKAKQDKKYKGRQPTARAKAAEVIKFDAEGLQRAEIARRTGIGIASVYRVLADAKKLDVGRTCAAQPRRLLCNVVTSTLPMHRLRQANIPRLWK